MAVWSEKYIPLSEITPNYLREKYLWGLDLRDQNGNPFPDVLLSQKIDVAVSTVENLLQITIAEKTIVDEAHDYYINDYQLFAFILLKHYPVVRVTKIGAQYPTGQSIIDFPIEWVKLRKESGQIQLVPTYGTLSQVILGRGGGYLPMIYSGLGYLPDLFRVDYVAGFENNIIPMELADIICKIASIEILSVYGDIIFPPGISSMSLSIDGISQSVSVVNSPSGVPAFAGRLYQYTRDLYGDGRTSVGAIKKLKNLLKGVRMVVLG